MQYLDRSVYARTGSAWAEAGRAVFASEPVAVIARLSHSDDLGWGALAFGLST